MGFKKTHDLACKVGTYEKNGETKGRYVNVGLVLHDDDGKSMILLNRTFNPAGVPNPDNKDTVIISKFEVKDKQAAPVAAPATPAEIPWEE